jgi:hypothetical protein
MPWLSVPYDLIGGVDRVTLRGTIQLLGVAPIRDALISGRPIPGVVHVKAGGETGE